MRALSLAISVVAGSLIAGSVMAVEMPPLAQKNKCTGCHAIDRKLVGPAWMDVSKKYRGVKGAQAKLVAKVKNGGKGVWGDVVAMPPQAAPEAEVKELVKFILGLDK